MTKTTKLPFGFQTLLDRWPAEMADCPNAQELYAILLEVAPTVAAIPLVAYQWVRSASNQRDITPRELRFLAKTELKLRDAADNPVAEEALFEAFCAGTHWCRSDHMPGDTQREGFALWLHGHYARPDDPDTAEALNVIETALLDAPNASSSDHMPRAIAIHNPLRDLSPEDRRIIARGVWNALEQLRNR